MPNERSRTEKDKYFMIDLYKVPRRGKFIEMESRREVTEDQEGGVVSYCLMGSEFLFGLLEKFWKWIVVVVT